MLRIRKVKWISIFLQKYRKSKVVTLLRSDIFTLFLFSQPQICDFPRPGYVRVCRKVGYTPVWNLNNDQAQGNRERSPTDNSAKKSTYRSYFTHHSFFFFSFISFLQFILSYLTKRIVTFTRLRTIWLLQT